MTRTQAIAILRASKPLAYSLLNSTLQPSLYPNEGEILIGLQEVVDAGLAQDTEIYREAGLDTLEYNALLARLAYHHARGDDRSDLGMALLSLKN
jgi:hypothetical protein